MRRSYRYFVRGLSQFAMGPTLTTSQNVTGRRSPSFLAKTLRLTLPVAHAWSRLSLSGALPSLISRVSRHIALSTLLSFNCAGRTACLSDNNLYPNIYIPRNPSLVDSVATEFVVLASFGLVLLASTADWTRGKRGHPAQFNRAV